MTDTAAITALVEIRRTLHGLTVQRLCGDGPWKRDLERALDEIARASEEGLAPTYALLRDSYLMEKALESGIDDDGN